MKKLLKNILIVFMITVFAFGRPVRVTAANAWIAKENFDSYTAGASIDGDAGGCGWSGNWSLITGTVTTENSPAGGQGGKAISSGLLVAQANRAFTSIDNSVVHFQFYSTDATALNERDVTFNGAGTSRFSFRINVSTGGRYYASDGTSYNTDLGAFTTNAWHTVDIKFGHVAGKFAISFDGGAYSADNNATGGISAVDTFIFIDAQTPVGTFYVDDVGDVASASCGGGAVTYSDDDALIAFLLSLF